MTPLQAVKTTKGREMVDALLKDFERKYDPSNFAGYEPDWNSMRKKLGLG